jgi:hypothetical protein
MIFKCFLHLTLPYAAITGGAYHRRLGFALIDIGQLAAVRTPQWLNSIVSTLIVFRYPLHRNPTAALVAVTKMC